MMVTTLSKLLGKDLTYVDHSPEEMAAMMLETGMPESFVRMLQESMERTRRNESVVITDDFKAITGRAPRTFEQWATAHKDFFK